MDELYSFTQTRHRTQNPYISEVKFQHYLGLIQSDCISQIVILYCYHRRLELKMTSRLKQTVSTYSSNALVTGVNKHLNSHRRLKILKDLGLKIRWHLKKKNFNPTPERSKDRISEHWYHAQIIEQKLTEQTSK